jgi:hypothetical protein
MIYIHKKYRRVLKLCKKTKHIMFQRKSLKPKYILRGYPAVHGAMSFKLVWRCHQLLSVFLAKGHLPRV